METSERARAGGEATAKHREWAGLRKVYALDEFESVVHQDCPDFVIRVGMGQPEGVGGRLDGLRGRPRTRASLPVVKGLSCPGSPTTRSRLKRAATESRWSERIWYTSSMTAACHPPVVTKAHFLAGATTP